MNEMKLEFTEREINSLLALLTGLVEEPWASIRIKLEQEQQERSKKREKGEEV